MGDERQWRWILPVLLISMSIVKGDYQPTMIADMESSDCDKIGPYTIGDNDIMLIKANPPQRPGGTATRDKCIVNVETSPNRRLKVYISDFSLFDCGTILEIFEGKGFMTSPAIILKCGEQYKKYDSRTEALKFRLVKQSPASLNFRFNFVVTTDQGPDIDFERANMSYNNGVLAPGVIVGIAIAGVIIFVALLAIFIYCVVKQRKKNLDAEKTEPTVYTSENSKVMFPNHKKPRTGSYESGSDSHNSSYSSADGQNTYVNMNPDPKGRRGKSRQGYDNRAYASSEDGGHDRSRDSTGSDDIGSGVVNGSFESASDAPSGRRYVSKNQENGHASGSISRSARSGSARKTRNRKNSSNDGDRKPGPSSQRSRSRSGHRSGHRDSGRRSRSHGDHGGSQRRSRSRSPHSQSSNHSASAFDSKGHNRMYDISSLAKRSRESSNSSTSSRDSGEERNVSYNPAGRRDDRDRGRSRHRDVEQDQYGSQV